MPKIFKQLAKGRTHLYEFPEAEEIVLPNEAPAPVEPEISPEESVGQGEREERPQEPESLSQTPIDYARLQAEVILQDAHRQADEILAVAREQAARESEEIKASAKTAGYQEGFQQGMTQALSDGAAKLREDAEAQGTAVQQFLEKANETLERQLDDHVEELRDLALAVAEKVVCVSLKSSADVIGRMIQTAIDKRKRCEWVRIYIAEYDAKRMSRIPDALATALAALSDRVRIIPMADDESGACIIEMPNEIVDASASTQIKNIRALLSDTPSGGDENRLR